MNTVLTKVKICSLDEEIAKLEKQLNEDTSDSDDSSEGEDEKVYSAHDSLKIVKSSTGKVVKICSALVDEKIESLPSHQLPLPQCSKRKGEVANPSKRIKFQEATSTPTPKLSGIEATVREMLKNYQPSSQERRPFYCRVCQFQGQNLAEFEEHRESQFHKVAVEVERRTSSCKPCRKQFTSPEQLKEHLRGTAHKQRMESLRSKQATRKEFS